MFKSTKGYFNFITLEDGLHGLFHLRSPREIIEGFKDPLLYEISQLPIYLGGN